MSIIPTYEAKIAELRQDPSNQELRAELHAMGVLVHEERKAHREAEIAAGVRTDAKVVIEED